MSLERPFRPKIHTGSIYQLQCLTACLFTIIYFYLPVGIMVRLFAPTLMRFQYIHMDPHFLLL